MRVPLYAFVVYCEIGKKEDTKTRREKKTKNRRAEKRRRKMNTNIGENIFA